MIRCGLKIYFPLGLRCHLNLASHESREAGYEKLPGMEVESNGIEERGKSCGQEDGVLLFLPFPLFLATGAGGCETPWTYGERMPESSEHFSGAPCMECTVM
jgi:hypothetical protein